MAAPVDVGKGPVDNMRAVTSRRAALGGVLAFVVTFAVIRQSATPPPSPVDEALAPEPAADSTRETALGAAAPETGSGFSELLDEFPAVQAPQESGPAGLLVAAAGAGDAERVRELLAAGVAADSDSQGSFAIHRAAASGSVAVLRLLVDAGAHLEALDQNGSTALTQAAFYGNSEAVVFLLEPGRQSERPCRTDQPDAPEGDPERLDDDPVAAVAAPCGRTRNASRRPVALIEAGADPHFGPGDHPPPAVLAEALGGEIGRLFAGDPADPVQRPR